MKALDPNDQLYLFLDKPRQPMHVGLLQLFQLPEDAGNGYLKDLAEQTRAHVRATSPFNKRLVSRLGMPFWQYEDELNLDVHVHHEALVHPGRIRELLSSVSAKHSSHLDPNRPRWELHLVEGLPDRRFAAYVKVHHSLIDGVSAMRLMMQSFSPDPDRTDTVPFFAAPKDHRGVRDPDASLGHYLRTTARHAGTVPALMREAIKQSRRARSHSDSVPMFGAPKCMLSEPVSGARRVAAQSYPLPRVRAIAAASKSTVNDIVLAACGSALRHYLASHGALPDRPLIAMVPMSLRKNDSTASANLFATILTNMGTHLADPLQRLHVVKQSMQEGKERYLKMTPTEAVNYSALALAPTALNLLTGLKLESLPYNLVISNLPGPRHPLYWNRSRLEELYPFSIVLDRQALNLTFVSYLDRLQFGLVGCARALPSMQRLLQHLEGAFVELEDALQLPAAEPRSPREGAQVPHDQPLQAD